jgi:putative transposase
MCVKVGITRQGYYAKKRKRQRQEVDANFVVELVKRERQIQPRLGVRKLHYMLRKDFEDGGISIGRDRMFAVLREHGLLLEPRRSGTRTTNSRHSLPVFSNLIKDIKPKKPHQIWVSDITYIRTMEGFMYASLITDKMSHKLVGHNIGDSLESSNCQVALKKAIKQLPEGSKPIHHSDRGCQYCCHDYVNLLKEEGLSISMTEELHCYENSVAERVNGILKQEYFLDVVFETKEQARIALEQAVMLYNERRPHLSLSYQTPSQVHVMAA